MYWKSRIVLWYHYNMKPNIDLSPKALKEVAALLNTLLSDEAVLYIKTLNTHWNVEGPNFSELHKFFESQYEELSSIMDDVAERARALGGKALGSLQEFLNHTRLKEASKPNQNAKAMIQELLSDHESIIKHLRKDLETCDTAYHDIGTNDFLTGLMEKHEKMAWMLRAFIS